jgi:hypothetical protein
MRSAVSPQGQSNGHRFPSLFAVHRDRHFEPRILNSQIKSPKLLFSTLFVHANKRIRKIKVPRITRADCINLIDTSDAKCVNVITTKVMLASIIRNFIIHCLKFDEWKCISNGFFSFSSFSYFNPHWLVSPELSRVPVPAPILIQTRIPIQIPTPTLVGEDG